MKCNFKLHSSSPPQSSFPSLQNFPESPPEHQSRAGQSEREGEPDACQSPIKDKTEEVACRKGDDEIGDESDVHHRFDIGDASERI